VFDDRLPGTFRAQLGQLPHGSFLSGLVRTLGTGVLHCFGVEFLGCLLREPVRHSRSEPARPGASDDHCQSHLASSFRLPQTLPEDVYGFFPVLYRLPE
jgi:hypothetical protein